ncbi:MAG: AAA family ATPase [Solirubrobacterales bacterium]|nr:AAA family ATPase [Solirubrobacterales bacterium]
MARSALLAATRSERQILVVDGEAGIGKTAFVRGLLATTADVVALEASGEESEENLDYGVLAQLELRAALLSGDASRVGEISHLEHLSARGAGSMFSAGGELLAALGSLQDVSPVAVVIDDAHWIDQPSARALLFAVRRLQADRVAVVLVTRPNGLERLGEGWARLVNDPDLATRVRLAGLSATEVGLLAEAAGFGPLAAAEAERLREHTGGHPLYVKALLEELPSEALHTLRGPLPAPHSFAATVLSRLAHVGTEAQDLVAAAAVAGGPCPLALAGAVADLADPLVALEEALAADLLMLSPAPAREEIGFPHPLIRAAVYDDLSLTRRRRLHLAYASLTSGPTSLSHRVAATPGDDDALAGGLADAARDETAAGDLSRAIEHWLAASTVAASRGVREAALLAAVDCLGLAGDVPRAQALRNAVLACGDSARRSFTLGTLSASAGRLKEAKAALREVTERPDFTADPELAAKVTASLAIVCAYAGDGAEAITWAQRALCDAPSAVTADVTARQALALGMAWTGRPRDGIGALAFLSPSRIEPRPFEPELLATRGHLKVWAGDLDAATEDLSAVIRWSRAGLSPRSLPNTYASLAETEYHLGRWSDGLLHADVAVSLALDSDQVWELAFVHAVASFLHAGRGEWDSAADHVDAARRAADSAPLPVNVYYAHLAGANLSAARGDWKSALRALRLLGAEPADTLMVNAGQCAARLLEAEALLRTGDLAGASRLVAALGDGASPRVDTEIEVELPPSAGNLLAVHRSRLIGLLEFSRERRAEARRAFAHGLQLSKTVGSPVAGAMVQLAYGRFLRHSGGRRAATTILSQAREEFARVGAAPLLEQCDAELVACGVRADRDGFRDGYRLTARERVVARLIASGKSNREVAAELYLSTKTVEYHLANIFMKVGIRSRHQLASVLTDSQGFS